MRFDTQEALAAHVRSRLSAQIEEAHRLVEPLTRSQRDRPRHDGGWSANEVLGHLARMNETYLPALTPLADTPSPSDARTSTWKPTLPGRLLYWSVTTSMKVKTPAIFNPEALTYRGEPLNGFIDSHRRLLRLLDRLEGRDWSSLRCSSPAATWYRMNPGDVFLVLAAHGDRHLEQLRHLRNAVLGGGPADQN